MAKLGDYTAWANVPDNLKTKTQLGKIGLKPAKGQKPAADFESHFYGKSRPRFYDLYDMSEAVEKRKPSEAQLEALAKAREAAKIAQTCKRCNEFAGWRRMRRDGFCIRCHRERRAEATAAEWLAAEPLFLDTETTGLDAGAEIVEIGVIGADGEILLDTLVKSTIPIPAEVTAIHGISDADVAGAPSFAELAPRLRELFTDRLIVIYNAEFDEQMLQQSATAHELDKFELQSQCAMSLYAEWWGDYSDYHQSYTWQSLGSVLSQCDLTVAGDMHRAAADAEACRQVVRYLAAKATNQIELD